MARFNLDDDPLLNAIRDLRAASERLIDGLAARLDGPSPGAEPVVGTRPEGDPSQRLDALARLLDDRLRRAQGTVTGRPEPPSPG